MIYLKRLLFAFALCLCVCIACVPAFAAEAETGEGTSVPVVNVYNEFSAEIPVNSLIYAGSQQLSLSVSDGLKGVLVSFIGEWESITVQHSYVDSSGNTVVDVETIPDYPWIAAAVLLCLMVFCLFRVGGALICKV